MMVTSMRERINIDMRKNININMRKKINIDMRKEINNGYCCTLSSALGRRSS
jgi:hypothetical protein